LESSQSPKEATTNHNQKFAPPLKLKEPTTNNFVDRIIQEKLLPPGQQEELLRIRRA
jgi:hypothetical protein